LIKLLLKMMWISDIPRWYTSHSFRQESQWVENTWQEEHCQVCCQPETSCHSSVRWWTCLLWNGPGKL